MDSHEKFRLSCIYKRICAHIGSQFTPVLHIAHQCPLKALPWKPELTKTIRKKVKSFECSEIKVGFLFPLILSLVKSFCREPKGAASSSQHLAALAISSLHFNCIKEPTLQKEHVIITSHWFSNIILIKGIVFEVIITITIPIRHYQTLSITGTSQNPTVWRCTLPFLGLLSHLCFVLFKSFLLSYNILKVIYWFGYYWINTEQVMGCQGSFLS